MGVGGGRTHTCLVLPSLQPSTGDASDHGEQTIPPLRLSLYTTDSH